MSYAPLRYAMIGGGPNSFMGPVHRAAVAMSGTGAVLAAGCFSRRSEANAQMADLLGLPAASLFTDYKVLATQAKSLKLDFVVIITRSSSHYAISKAFLEAGIAVSCDKPVALTVAEAEELRDLAGARNLDFMVTYTYGGYPMIAEARRRIRDGELGEVRLVRIDYQQDWMPRRFEPAADKSPFWRADGKEGGPSCCVSDIGVHAEFLMRWLSGKNLKSLSARLQNYTPGHILDDNAFIMGDLGGGAFANIWCSQVSVGRHNDISLRIVGSKGGLEWRHNEADKLILHRLGQPEQILRKGDPDLDPLAKRHSFLPLEHPEGVLEAFGSLYKGFCRTLMSRHDNQPQDPLDAFPTIEDGLMGVRFVQQCLESNRQGGAWVGTE